MIVLKNIKKQFNQKQVLQDISFHIAPKESVGIIGLNGAGKTTLLNIISGILKPDAGFIRVNLAENVMENHKVLKKFSYISGTKSQLWPDLKIRESYDNCAKMYGVEKKVYEERLAALSEIFQLEDLLHKQPVALSLGQRMRCEIVYGLLFEPQILMLDEAMIGLDVAVKHQIIKYFEQLKQEKKTTILYTSHNFSEIEKLCDRIILLDEGKILFDGSVERMMEQVAPLYRMQLKLEGGVPDFEDLPLEKYLVDQENIQIWYDKQKIETTQIIQHILKKSKIIDVQLYEPDLEGTIKKILHTSDIDKYVL